MKNLTPYATTCITVWEVKKIIKKCSPANLFQKNWENQGKTKTGRFHLNQNNYNFLQINSKYNNGKIILKNNCATFVVVSSVAENSQSIWDKTSGAEKKYASELFYNWSVN